MDQEPKQQAKRLTPLTLVLIIIIVLLVAAAAVLAVGKFGGEKEPEADSLSNGDTPLIGYEEGVTVVDDSDALQKAVDKAYAEAAEGGVPVQFKNDAVSSDGTTFSCLIGNPEHAVYDVYIQIFSDSEYTDQLYLSGLIPPGKAMKEIKLDHSLSKGSHHVYVVYTQVEDDHSTAHGQVSITMDFHVQ